tara:strand:+ start:300 stop:1043 length:744 start_codon:yes stop_codon:yes gene_type:complete
MSDNSYTLMYAAIVCFVCSFMLSLFAVGLQPAQQKAAKIDLYRNILSVFELGGTEMADTEVETTFQESIREIVIDTEGNVFEGQAFSDVPEKQRCELLYTKFPNNPEDCKLSVFSKVSDGEVAAYAIPLEGKGLWSTLYGYLALEKDGSTIMGITFYKHGETPGLGAEISQPWFANNFKGKKLLDETGALTSVKVFKGKAKDSSLPEDHVVDGISGATITADGVTDLLKHCAQVFDPFLSKIRKAGA